MSDDEEREWVRGKMREEQQWWSAVGTLLVSLVVCAVIAVPVVCVRWGVVWDRIAGQ